MAEFIFSGGVLPPNAQVTLSRLWNEWKDPSPLRIEVVVTNGRVRVDVFTEPEPDDFGSFYNDVRELAQAMVDAYMFSSASDVLIDLDRVVMPDGRVVGLVPIFPGLRDVDDGSPATDDEMALSNRLIRLVPRSPALRSALADARRSLTSGRETPFHAYRAVESVRQHFALSSDEKAKHSWDRMWEALSVDRSVVEAFDAAATARRHGEMNEYSHDERKLAILSAREVIRRFADYLETSTQGESAVAGNGS